MHTFYTSAKCQCTPLENAICCNRNTPLTYVAGWAGWWVGWLVGWLAGWLDGWLAGWLGGWWAGWLVGWLAGLGYWFRL